LKLRGDAVKQRVRTSHYSSGDIQSYYFYNKLHREDGPARIYYYPNGSIKHEFYYKNDKKHRDDGPAIIVYNINGNITSKQYYLNGKKVTDDLQILVIQTLELVK
jgi:antitoxin component YwqK of YwqJK toxin-antitoxin module